MLRAFVMIAIAAGAADAGATPKGRAAPVAAPAPKVGVPSYRQRATPAVKRNAIIRVRYKKGGLSIESTARALSSGEIGERIHVMNADSHKTFSAYVSAKDEAVVK